MTLRGRVDKPAHAHRGPTPKPQPEREQTDEGLREERQNTDQVLAERLVADEASADAVVKRAREQATRP